MWRQREDESRRMPVNRKCARLESTDDQQRKRKTEVGKQRPGWALDGSWVGGGEQAKRWRHSWRAITGTFLKMIIHHKRFGTAGTDPQKRFPRKD